MYTHICSFEYSFKNTGALFSLFFPLYFSSNSLSNQLTLIIFSLHKAAVCSCNMPPERYLLEVWQSLIKNQLVKAKSQKELMPQSRFRYMGILALQFRHVPLLKALTGLIDSCLLLHFLFSHSCFRNAILTLQKFYKSYTNCLHTFMQNRKVLPSSLKPGKLISSFSYIPNDKSLKLFKERQCFYNIL